MSRPTKIAVITGAAQGIGRSSALLLANQGYALALNDLRSPADTRRAAEGRGVEVLEFAGDISDEENVGGRVQRLKTWSDWAHADSGSRVGWQRCTGEVGKPCAFATVNIARFCAQVDILRCRRGPEILQRRINRPRFQVPLQAAVLPQWHPPPRAFRRYNRAAAANAGHKWGTASKSVSPPLRRMASDPHRAHLIRPNPMKVNDGSNVLPESVPSPGREQAKKSKHEQQYSSLSELSGAKGGRDLNCQKDAEQRKGQPPQKIPQKAHPRPCVEHQQKSKWESDNQA